MGYYTAMRTTDTKPDGTYGSMANPGKMSEYYSRKYYDPHLLMKSLNAVAASNHDFCKKF
jgi:hypothetical protein